MRKKINLQILCLPAVFFLLVAAIRLAPFFWGRTLALFDNYSLMVPIKLFQAGWLRQGVLPLWNPLLFSGISLVGDINQSLWYPTTLLFTLLPTVYALNTTLVLHLALTGLGMFLLAKQIVKQERWALLAGAWWLFSPQITTSLYNLSVIQTLAWTPWVMWLGWLQFKQPRAKWWLPIIITLQLAAGYPQHVLYAVFGGLFLSGFKVWQRHMKWWQWVQRWLMVGVVSVTLSAWIWLPFIQTLLHSTRVLQSNEQSVVGSLHPIEVVKILVPTIFDHPQLGLRWGPSWNGMPYLTWYVGWLGLLVPVLVLFSKRRTQLDMWLAGEVVFTLWFALGQYAPGFRWLQEILPILQITRIPTTILGMGTILMILWVVNSWLRFSLSKQVWWRLLIVGGVVLGLSIGGWILSRHYPQYLWELLNQLTRQRLVQSAFHTLERDSLIINNLVRSLLVNGSLLVVVLWLWRLKKWRWLLACLMIDVFINTQYLLLFAPASVYPPAPQVTAHQIFPDFTLSPQDRVVTRNLNHPYTGWAAYWEALTVRPPFSDSYITAHDLKDFSHLNRYRRGLTPDWNLAVGVPVVNGYTTLLPRDYQQLWSMEPEINQLAPIKLDNPLLSVWAVKYYLVDTWFEVEEDLSALPLIAKQDDWQLYELPSLPRFRFEDGSPVELVNFRETPNRLSFSFENRKHQSQLIVADRYDPQWQAVVNQQSVEIINHHGMRLIPLQPGYNQLELQFVPRWLYIGGVISILSMLGWWKYRLKIRHNLA